MSTIPINLVADDVHITYRSYLDPQVDLRDRLKGGRSARRRHINVEAVRGVSFELRAGESLGLIGHNGAGKSTILLGLAGLLPLQRGTVLARSRPTLLGVASVLNTALSGRRNIEIGCLAMGMPKHEIDRRMDELVEFAGLEEAIDLPLKAYSSGMRARLSFTVATVETPEVLLVDEALAVGDAQFRVKATQRLEEIRHAAGSVIVVSHNMGEVERMCDRALWLDHGIVVREGNARRLIRLYGATRANPDLVASMLVDEEEPLGPLRPMTLQHVRDNRFVAEQVDPWEVPNRREMGGFPRTVAPPSALDTSAVSPARAAQLEAVHSSADRPPHPIEGALLRDWLVDPATGVVLAEWPSLTQPNQSLVLQESFAPLAVADRPEWEEAGGTFSVARSIPRSDEPASAIYCWTRWPDDPLHWWTDVATPAFLAATDDRLRELPLLTSPLLPWQADALNVLGVDLERIHSLDPDGDELVRFSELYFAGAFSFGRREEVSVDAAVAVAAEAAALAVAAAGAEQGHQQNRRVFVPRQRGPGRRITNRRELDEVLSEFGIDVVPPELPFDEMVRMFSSAELVIARSGGSLLGSLFSPEKTSVIELQPETFPLSTGRALSALGRRSHSILACPVPGASTRDPRLAATDNIEVPCDALRSLLITAASD